MIKFNKKDDLFISVDEKINHTLLNEHIYFLSGEIDDEKIKHAMQWLTFENLQSNEDKILQLYINSPGGSLYDSFALIDMMRASLFPIRTIGIGSVMSSAFLIFASGTKGERYIYKNTGIMCHQFSDTSDGKYHDIKASVKEGDLCNHRMAEILKNATSLDEASVKRKFLKPTDSYFKAEELLSLGIADHIV